MSEQRTPDELSTENELICQKLLGWKPCSRHVVHGWMEWAVEPGPKFYRTPTFDSWREAGLILDALLGQFCAIEVCTAKWTDGEVRSGIQITPYDPRERKTLTTYGLPLAGPQAIRAAALEYIKAVKS